MDLTGEGGSWEDQQSELVGEQWAMCPLSLPRDNQEDTRCSKRRMQTSGAEEGQTPKWLPKGLLAKAMPSSALCWPRGPRGLCQVWQGMWMLGWPRGSRTMSQVRAASLLSQKQEAWAHGSQVCGCLGDGWSKCDLSLCQVQLDRPSGSRAPCHPLIAL